MVNKLLLSNLMMSVRQYVASHRQQNHIKTIQDITDEEGLKQAYDTKDGLYQHYIKLFIAGTKDPIDMVGDL